MSSLEIRVKFIVKLSMFLTIVIVSVLSMLLGALAFALLNKKSNPEKSRGRNIKLATYVGMVFVVYVAIAFVPWLLYIITALLIFIALREILAAASSTGKRPYLALLLSVGILYCFAIFIKSTPWDIQLFTYFIVIHFDGFSQVSGESFGKHKIFPKISPAKTWEGLFGGILVAFLVSLIVYKFTNLGQSLTEIIILTAIIVAAAFTGDILASAYKRYCGIKDYSNLIPGHGGILDRFDSFFMAGAIIQILQWFYAQS